MEDALRELAALEGVPPRDAILARALIRQGLAAADQVLAAARAVASDAPGKGILARLTASGGLTEERARKIEEAFERRIADRKAAAPAAAAEADRIEGAEEIEEAEEVDTAGAAEGPGVAEPAQPVGSVEPPRPAGHVDPEGGAGPESSASASDAGDGAEAGNRARRGMRMWRPRRRTSPEGEADEKPTGLAAVEASAQKARSERASVDSFVQKFIRSRLHQLMMDDFARMGAGVADPRALAKRHGAKEKDIRRILEDWRRLGILKTVGAFPFCFDPPPTEKEAANLFRRAWRDPIRHGELLKMILEMEGT